MNNTRLEYPRPQFRRDSWLALNGEWEFEFDDKNEGESKGYHTGNVQLTSKIIVPFTYQYPASGIGVEEKHEIVWYRRKFNHDGTKNALLNFNASDYVTDVWVNGYHVKNHVGGFSPFSVDISKYLLVGENVIVVKCYDPYDPTIPRGKQSWTGKQFGCWYIPNTGIWQSVWLDYFEVDAIEKYTLTPNIDENSFSGQITTLYGIADAVEINVYFNNELIKKQIVSLDGKYTRYSVRLMENDFVGENMYWWIDHPNLIYVDFKLLKDSKVIDLAHTRFGMRKIEVDEFGNVCLNNNKVYQRLILDQGYWPETGLTPPSHVAIKEDIELAKKMGFNGARKHEKFEDPYFYYYAEELGFLTWCEMPSAYNFNEDEIYAISTQWQEILSVARNFTSVICYVLLNESWGVRKIITDKDQQNFGRGLYYLTKSLDSSRLISINDGWENVHPTDIITVHDYAFDGEEFARKYRNETADGEYGVGRKVMAYGNHCENRPIIFSEFGGIAMKNDATNGNWGYNQGANDEEELLTRLDNLLKGIHKANFQGFCYTQLSDVQQEVNGLLDKNHKPKVDVEKLRKIFEQ